MYLRKMKYRFIKRCQLRNDVRSVLCGYTAVLEDLARDLTVISLRGSDSLCGSFVG